jgi:hypothetical protein
MMGFDVNHASSAMMTSKDELACRHALLTDGKGHAPAGYPQ